LLGKGSLRKFCAKAALALHEAGQHIRFACKGGRLRGVAHQPGVGKGVTFGDILGGATMRRFLAAIFILILLAVVGLVVYSYVADLPSPTTEVETPATGVGFGD
jgi:hypothetical protein